ncbi:MAG: rhodanese-like domain-containing protein [Microbacteriaceae bacterium]
MSDAPVSGAPAAGPLLSALELERELSSGHPPAVLDASHLLHAPRFDGDHRHDSGRARWEAARIPGSVHVEVTEGFSVAGAPQHYSHPEPQALADVLAALGVTRARRVVVADSTGGLFAARLWYLLDWIGVDVRVLDGGVPAWRAAELPVESGPAPAPVPVPSWPAVAVRDAWVERDELVARAADDARPLVCGLPTASFDGSAPTRYARRGRIPGSVSVPARDLFGPGGLLAAPAAVRAAYRAAGVGLGPEDAEVLLYCGGGISAAANALALAAVGVRRVRVYDGSLEEWAADPALPLELG